MALVFTSCYRLTELFTTDSGEKRHGNTRQEVSREGREQGQEANEEIDRSQRQENEARRESGSEARTTEESGEESEPEKSESEKGDSENGVETHPGEKSESAISRGSSRERDCSSDDRRCD